MELYSIIKNDGPGGLLFWKYSGEDFRVGSQLIVAENEEALFYQDGVIYEKFTGGKFTLQTANYPFIDRLLAKFTGNVNAFSCKVFFINKADALELKWGTDSPIQVRDPAFGILTQVVARGAYTIRIADSKKFVLKFVGNNYQAVTEDAIRVKFRSAIMQKIKSIIAHAIKTSNEEILGIASQLDDFANVIKPEIVEIMNEYGVELVNFYIAALDIPENAPGRVELEKAMAQRAQFQVLGDNWQRLQARDIMMTAAQNPGVPGLGAGIGLGLASLGSIGGMAKEMMDSSCRTNQQNPPAQESSRECPSCHEKIERDARFCAHCGSKLQFCPQCGQNCSSRFCPNCGTKVGE